MKTSRRNDEDVIEISDGEEGDYETIWLKPKEYNTRLPDLLNCSSRRKKTMDSLFPHLANRIYRCTEFPQGIYINEHGELCPNDKRSGIYKKMTDEMLQENSSENDDDEEDEDEDSEEESSESEADEGKRSVAKKRTASSRRDDEAEEDEDYLPEEDDEDEIETESDLSEEVDEILNHKREKHWADKEDQVKHVKKKRRVQKDEDDDDADEEDEDEYEEEEEEEEEVKEDEKVGENLTKEQKLELYLEDLKSSAENYNRLHEAEEKKRPERIRIQKAINFLESFTESWNDIRKKVQKAQKLQKASNNSNNRSPGKTGIQMSYDSHLFAEDSGCDFLFKKKGTTHVATATLNCDDCTIRCECLQSFSVVEPLYHHIASHFDNST